MMKRTAIFLLSIVFLASVQLFAQTYAPLPYATSFESGSLDASWTTVLQGTGGNLARVQVVTANGPYHLTRHLTLDKNSSNTNIRTGEAWLHLDLSGQTEVTLSFYFKDFGDENNTGTDGDGIFFSDDHGLTFTEVFHIDPTTYTDNVWQKITLDVDVLAAANALSLTDSFVVKFQQRDNNSIDIADLGGVSDGHAYDSVYVRVGGALTPGRISGNDTICGGAASVAITNVELPTEGDNTYTYTWQYSTNFSTWTTLVVPSSPNLTFTSPPNGIFWVRRGVSSPSTGEGPVYTTPSMIFITSPTYVDFYGLETSYCTLDPAEVLSGSPPGGTYTATTGLNTGTGTFTPASAPNSAGGTVTNIIYSYTDAFGCTYNANHSTTVYASPTVSITDLGAYSENQSTPVVMNGSGLPSGGTELYVGPGVAGNEFTPSASGGPGNKVITYTYTAPNGCSRSTTIDADITSAGSGSIIGLASSYCVNDNTNYPISATGGTPTGLSGPGVTSLTPTTATFNPATAGVGTHYVTYSYTINLFGYIIPLSFGQAVTVNPRPTVYWTSNKYNFCTSDAVEPLTGWYYNSATFSWTTVSGTFTGTGVSGSTFAPGTAGAGSHGITFSYTDGNGCSNSYSGNVSVNSLPVVNFSGLNTSYCRDAAAATLTGSPTGGTFSGSGISGNTFNPSLGVVGSQNVTYSYTDGNGCTNTNVKPVTVNALPVLTMTGLPLPLYCEDATVKVISGFENGNPAPLGVFGGPSVGFVDNSNGTATFTPSAMPVDSNYFIYFTYTDGNGCNDTITREVTIAALPDVSFSGLASQYCISDAVVALNPNQPTGVFSGTGVSGATFNPGFSTGLHNVTFTYTDENGCTNDTTRSTTVFALPVVSFAGLDAEYCRDAVIDTLVANVSGGYFEGVQAGNVFNDSAYLNVSNTSFLAETPYDITYTYTDINGCTNADTHSFVVHPLPIPNFTGLAASYCEDGAVSALIGLANASHPYGYGNSFFYGQFIPNEVNGTGINQANFDPTLVPIAVAGGQTSDTISFVYIDTKGCRDTIHKSTVVHGLPVISVSMGDSTLCVEDDPVLLSVSRPSGSGTESFYLSPSGASIIGGLFDPGSGSNNVGPNTIVFQFQDQFGCINYDTTSVTVYPEPIVNFYLGSYCNNDSISFFDSSFIAPFTVGTNDDVITNWYWTFGDGGNDTLEDPRHQYLIPTTYSIELTATTREGCVTSYDEQQLIGEPPVANFSWDNVCFGETLQFTDLSTAQAVDPIVTWVWSFGDGNGLDNSVGGHLGSATVVPADQNGGITGGTYGEPTHQYQTINSYNVSMLLETGSGCLDTIVKVIHIRPVIDTYPYSENFEASNGGWFAGGSTDGVADTYSWELGVANGNTIVDTVNNTSWVTNLDGDHNHNEQSYVDGPCFDFSSLTRPMIKMNVWADMLEGSDGAVLQYSLDNGVNWTVIGTIGDGINWYNKTSISGNPGNQAINQVGWSYQDTTWVEARHDLDMLIGEPQVRLRIAFGSDANSANEGIAFDNVWIGERSRIALLEYFTNSSDASSVQDDDYIDNLVFNNRKDVVDIQYHTEFPGSDVMNTHNPADPSARALFYGAFNIGRGMLNGNTYNGVSSEITNNHIKLQMLKDSPYSLVVGMDDDGTQLTATAYLSARQNIQNADVTVHLAVVEDQITALTGANGDMEFRSVLKKMLPSATGTLVKRDFVAGEEIGVSETWVMQNVFDMDKLNVVAFVQDNLTDEVYQVTTTDTGAVPPVVVPPLSQDEVVSLEPLKFKLLPNPANQHVTLLFNQLVYGSDIVFMDHLGRALNQVHVTDAMEYITFDVTYPAGVYYVRVVTADKVITEKLIIER